MVAGGALAGVLIAFFAAPDATQGFLRKISVEHGLTNLLSTNGYFLLGVLFFAFMGYTLYRIGIKKTEKLEE